MATITGSGKFVAIAANNNPFGFPSGISGIVFGIGNVIYGRIVPRYTLSGDTVTGTALCIDPGAENARLFLGFPYLAVFSMNGYQGYTGRIGVADYISDGSGDPDPTILPDPILTTDGTPQLLPASSSEKLRSYGRSYNFRCGLLLDPMSS